MRDHRNALVRRAMADFARHAARRAHLPVPYVASVAWVKVLKYMTPEEALRKGYTPTISQERKHEESRKRMEEYDVLGERGRAWVQRLGANSCHVTDFVKAWHHKPTRKMLEEVWQRRHANDVLDLF